MINPPYSLVDATFFKNWRRKKRYAMIEVGPDG